MISKQSKKLKNNVTALRQSKTMWATIIAAIAVALLLWSLLHPHPSLEWTKHEWWEKFIHPFIELFTVLVAFMIFWISFREEWLKTLKHRLTVHFVYEYEPDDTVAVIDNKSNPEDREMKYSWPEGDKKFELFVSPKKDKPAIPTWIKEGGCLVLFSCYEAVLSSETDARAWAQQLGQQMNLNNPLKFKPYFTFMKKQIRYVKLSKKQKEYFHLHTLIYYLSEVPKVIVTNPTIKRLVWYENFDDTPHNEKEKKDTATTLDELKKSDELHVYSKQL